MHNTAMHKLVEQKGKMGKNLILTGLGRFYLLLQIDV